MSNGAGIYALYCEPSRKLYVGRSVGMRKRVQAHRRDLRRGTHYNTHLQAAWAKYGEESFTMVTLEVVEDESLLPEREGFYCQLFQSHDQSQGYNQMEVTLTGGIRFSEEHKQKISAALMGHPVSAESIARTQASRKGFVFSDESRQKMSQAQRGRKSSEATKEKIRLNGNRGRKFAPWSEERRARLSEMFRGRTHTAETRSKISEGLRGKPKSEEHRQKMSEQKKGKSRSLESRQKQAETLRGRHRSPEASLQAASSNQGRTRTKEQRAKMSRGVQEAKLKKLLAADEPITLGSFLAILRNGAGARPAAVIEALRISRTTLHRWESGERHPKSKEIDALLTLYQASPEQRVIAIGLFVPSL